MIDGPGKKAYQLHREVVEISVAMADRFLSAIVLRIILRKNCPTRLLLNFVHFVALVVTLTRIAGNERL